MKKDASLLKVAVVTGAGQGIGRAVAHRLSSDGYAVALIDINAETLNVVKKEIESKGGQALALQADLTKMEDVQTVIGRAAEWGPLSILVNNAGRVIISPFMEISEN
jgi:meso-butanediol dehydrogenase / (S,S)-butanediol dehydrogenase / diacetyl reductase